jgi:hypothetical protein
MALWRTGYILDLSLEAGCAGGDKLDGFVFSQEALGAVRWGPDGNIVDGEDDERRISWRCGLGPL